MGVFASPFTGSGEERLSRHSAQGMLAITLIALTVFMGMSRQDL